MNKLKFPNDYRCIGIFERNTQNIITKNINKQLKEMYSNWHNTIINKADKRNLTFDEHNGIHYLTCFDSYINSNVKLMIIGKEANDKDYKLENYIEDFENDYQHDINYSYEYAISHPKETYAKDRKNTCYLKTRKLVSNFDNNLKSCSEDLEKAILSVLVNNLNKTSINGKLTPYNDNEFLYQEFKYNQLTHSVYVHELNILKPTHIIFLSGKGYDKHIIRDFGKDFYEELRDKIQSVNTNNKPISTTLKLNNDSIEKLLGIENYFTNINDELKIIYAIHPSAHMTVLTRNKYEESLKEFIKDRN
ncbi:MULTISPECIES: hypothetical protein [unclassified Ruminococcus]|uniref:hypothetical protein n=1 Tax=unclassified Ruminococcus TaxID=2608920 RepID=UPI00210E43E6|nr:MULTISPECIES: hypothetical protein [unclassified Ruminococcus]MCQ4021757.1 hypothetical protein [Ruminococcus sp. zg-924]MCQ4114201.1 hypothetical protein [Ruminococcus sp. zg-921]